MKPELKFWISIFGALAIGIGGGSISSIDGHADFSCREKVAALQERMLASEKVAALQERMLASEKKSDMILDLLKEIRSDIKEIRR